MRFAVLQFPASNCDQDAVHAVRVLGHQAEFVWHKDTSLGPADAVIVPGGFSYGDYLGWVLESSEGLAPASWGSELEVPRLETGSWALTLPMSPVQKFYRLRR